jgi:hypothetical protein
VSGRLDDEKLETLRRWGAGLGADGRDELRAAGKAILILIEEIERLQVDVWHMRGAAGERFAAAPMETAPETPAPTPRQQTAEEVAEEFFADGQSHDGLEPTLRDRLRRLLPARQVKME